MAHFQLLPKSAYQRSLWKNGLGHTDQIAIEPPGADLRKADFLFRLSTAKIEQSSTFSVFPDHDRTMVVLSGAGIRLIHTFPETGEEDTNELPPYEPIDFPGDLPSRCELIDGPVLDLGLFVRKGEVESQTEILGGGTGTPVQWMPTGRWNFLHAGKGDFELRAASNGSEEKFLLKAGDTLRLDLDEPWSEESAIEIIGLSKDFVAIAVGLQN